MLARTSIIQAINQFDQLNKFKERNIFKSEQIIKSTQSTSTLYKYSGNKNHLIKKREKKIQN